MSHSLAYITPALLSRGWRDKITMETKVMFTDGRINIRGNMIARNTPKKADYVLYKTLFVKGCFQKSNLLYICSYRRRRKVSGESERESRTGKISLT